MTPVIAILLAFSGTISFVLLFFAIFGSRSPGGAITRLEDYAKNEKKTPEKSEDQAAMIANLINRSETLDHFNRGLAKRSFGANLAQTLAQADLSLRPSEYLLIIGGMVIGIPIVMIALSTVIPFLRSPVVLIGGGIIGFMLPRFYVGRRHKKRIGAFDKQLPDTIVLLSNALRSGSSFLQAMELVSREQRPPIATEFGRVIREVNLGIPFQKALENLVRRIESEDLGLMATAISIQYQVGGNLSEILDSIAFTIRERIRIKGEIKTLTAQQRMSGYVVGFLPLGLAGMLFLVAPSFMMRMFKSPPEVAGIPMGVIILGVGITMMLIGFMFIRKIVDIKV